jgi:hypothetical protein
MTGYVDDTKGIINDMQSPHPITLDQLVKTMQADAQLWGDLVHTSGGALEIPKCNYYVMYWEFNDSGIPLLKENIDTTIRLENGDRTGSIILSHDSVNDAHKTLGCWKSAQRGQQKQEMVLQETSDDYARIITTSAVSRRDNWTAYYAIYLT